ncbi:MAG: ATP-binding cassette domain-containing protein [Thermotogota bacterium]
MFEMKNVFFKYKNNFKKEKIIFKDFSMIFPDDKNIFIKGKSGYGKTTLINLLSGLIKPDSGKIIYNDLNINEIDEKTRDNIRNKDFGFVFQESFFIDYLTIKENILLPVKKGTPNISPEKLSETLDILEILDKFPSEVSGGQKQRASIARALINSPKVLFVDEPTSSLDLKNKENVINLINKISKEYNLTVFYISHQNSTFEYDIVLDLEEYGND